jgi:hypothetical protein
MHIYYYIYALYLGHWGVSDSLSVAEWFKYNGTAVAGVNVTGAAIRLIVPVLSMKLSKWQASMAQFLQIPAKD